MSPRLTEDDGTKLSGTVNLSMPQDHTQNTQKSSQESHSEYSEYQPDGSVKVKDWDPILPFPTYDLPSFPTDTLPEWLRDFVEAEAEAMQTPEDLQALLALGVVSVAVTGKVKIQVGEGPEGWKEPLNSYSAIVMESGERKSPAVRQAIGPIEDYEAECNRKLRDEIVNAVTERDFLAAEIQRYKKVAANPKTPPAQKKDLLDQAKRLAEELDALKVPKPLQLLADDVTPEALPGLLQEQGGRLAIVSSEGGLFDTLAGRYNNGIPNLDGINKAHDGDMIRVNRTGRPPEYISNPAVTLLLTPQPHVIRELVNKTALRGCGFLARFLFSLPQSKVGYRDNRTPATPQRVLQAYRQNLTRLLDLAPDQADDGNTHPHILRLTPEARETLLSYQDRVEVALRPGEDLGDLKDWGNKHAGRVARICGLLHLAEHASVPKPWTIPVSAETMERAIQIGDYLIPHAGAVFAEIGLDKAFDDAKAIAAWIKRNKVHRFTRRDAHQSHRSRFQQAVEIDRPLGILEERNYIRKCKVKKRSGPGQPASPTYDVNPDLWDTQNTQNSGIALLLSLQQQGLAHQYAAGRQSTNRNRRPEEDLGSPDKNYAADYWGGLAEVGIVEWLVKNGLQPEGYVPLASRAVTKPDLTLNGIPIEIKSVPPGQEYICISERQHRDERRRPDYYLIAVFESHDFLRLYGPVPYDDVSAWTYREEGHEPYYSTRWDSLPALTGLDTLRKIGEDCNE